MDRIDKLCLPPVAPRRHGARAREDAQALQGWFIVIIAIVYVTLLFAVASIGDRRSSGQAAALPRPHIYALSLAIYCTS